MATGPRQALSESSDHWRTILTEQNSKIRILHDDGLSITMIAVGFGVPRAVGYAEDYFWNYRAIKAFRGFFNFRICDINNPTSRNFLSGEICIAQRGVGCERGAKTDFIAESFPLFELTCRTKYRKELEIGECPYGWRTLDPPGEPEEIPQG
jgi:hypothetical protein